MTSDLKPSPTKIRQLREAGGYSRMEFAAVVSRGERTIYRWEEGKTCPSQLELRTLARFLRVEPAALCEVGHG